MNRFNTKNKKNNTIKIKIFIVFFSVILNAIILFNIYGNKTSNDISILIDQKINKILYQYFNELITNDIINNESIRDILNIHKNNNEEILSVHYNMEKTYKILTDVSKILKESINNLENGTINVSLYDRYLENGKNGLILKVPLSFVLTVEF